MGDHGSPAEQSCWQLQRKTIFLSFVALCNIYPDTITRSPRFIIHLHKPVSHVTRCFLVPYTHSIYHVRVNFFKPSLLSMFFSPLFLVCFFIGIFYIHMYKCFLLPFSKLFSFFTCSAIGILSI